MFAVWLASGTRPEIIKLAPVYRALKKLAHVRTSWIATGQHTSLAREALATFGIEPDLDLEVRRGAISGSKRQNLPSHERGAQHSVAGLLSELIARFDKAMVPALPDLVVVQGDTTSAIACALASFARGIPVAHVEAGLRTFDLARPFPEEGWRRVISQIAALHFAPTSTSAENLARNGVALDTIRVTGNTVIDSLHWLLAQHAGNDEIVLPDAAGRLILVTLHRRENWQDAFSRVCDALLAVRDAVEDVEILFVCHANPALRQQAVRRLGKERRIHVLNPLPYGAFIRLLRRSALVLTDSGGIQEEAPALGIPLLVLRDATERPEAITDGVSMLVGTDPIRITDKVMHLLADPEAYGRMARLVNLFGDGHAAQRIAADILEFMERGMTIPDKPPSVQQAS